MTAARDKRNLDVTSLESLTAAKKICLTTEEGQEKESEKRTVDRYTTMNRNYMQAECRSRSLSDGGSLNDLRQRLRLYNSAQAEILTAKECQEKKSEKPKVDRYTSLNRNHMRVECRSHFLRDGGSLNDLRERLRLYDSLYDAARALGLTPEECLEAQQATFQCSVEEQDRSINPRRSIEKKTFGAASEEIVEGESTVDNGQRPTPLASPKDDSSPSIGSQVSSLKDAASSSATTQDTAQDRSTSDICLGPAATPNYATMSQLELRSLCRSRSLIQSGRSGPQLRLALTNYDKKLAKLASNPKVEADAKRTNAKPRIASSAFPPPIGFIDIDSSSQDDENPKQRTRLVGASATFLRVEPVLGYQRTVDKGKAPPVTTAAQVKARQGRSRELVSARTASEKGSYNPPGLPRLVLKHPRRTGNESISPRMLYAKHPMSLRQPLVSLLNFTMKDIKLGASESAFQGIQMEQKPPSEHDTRLAEKEEFIGRYATESPTWICCCVIPENEVIQKQPTEFSPNCLYHVSELGQRGAFTMREYQEYLRAQRALDRVKLCLCQELVIDQPGHKVKMTQGGFILAQIWREQLIRRQWLNLGPDMAAYRRKGIMEVMHNVLEDFMIEVSRLQQSRPLVLWARMEAMAWFVNTLPTTNEWHNFQEWSKPRRYIMLFGIALLTTIDALLQQNLFKDNESRLHNLALVLALFIRSTSTSPWCTLNPSLGENAYRSPFSDDICVNNENGWAAEVVSLADQNGIYINGVEDIDLMVQRWRVKRVCLASIRNKRTMEEQYAILHNGAISLPSEATLSTAAKEGDNVRGIGHQETVRAFWTYRISWPLFAAGLVPKPRFVFQKFFVCLCFIDMSCNPHRSYSKGMLTLNPHQWKPEDDYDDNGQRLWKKWSYLDEFKTYTK